MQRHAGGRLAQLNLPGCTLALVASSLQAIMHATIDQHTEAEWQARNRRAMSSVGGKGQRSQHAPITCRLRIYGTPSCS